VRTNVGQGWAARVLCPQAFPGEAPEALRKRQAEIEAQYLELKKARDPIEKRRRLQAQMAEEHELLKLGTWVVKKERELQANEEMPAHLRSADRIAQLKGEVEDAKRRLHEFKQRIKERGGLTSVVKIEPSPAREPEPQPEMHAVAGGGWIQTET